MTRLRHPLKAYLRALRMTRVGTIVFVEGTENDPIFYDAIARRYYQETGRETELRLADELPNAALPRTGGGGGKRPLVNAAIYCESWRGTGANRRLRGKEIAFCVDKDADDILGLRVGCPALLYTLLHSAENHLVLGSDLHRAICCAISAAGQDVTDELGDCRQLRLLSHQWKEWVIHCLVSLRLGLTKTGNYGQDSPFNSPAHTAADQSAVVATFNDAKLGSGLSPQRFDAEVFDVTRLVNQLIMEDRFDEVFKGKWYINIFFSLLASKPVLEPRCRACGKLGLWIGIRSVFSLDERVYRYYADAFMRLR